jgi:hypothetical protein
MEENPGGERRFDLSLPSGLVLPRGGYELERAFSGVGLFGV